MSEPVWYYARGEVERGPFTSPQIKALAQAGKIRRDDLVWKEGMENWTAAHELRELFPAESFAGETAKPATGPLNENAGGVAASLPHFATQASSEFVKLLTTAAWGSLAVGVFCLVAARGCESFADGRLARVTAGARLEAVEEWQRQRTPWITELDSLLRKGRLTPQEQDRARDLNQLLGQLDAQRAAEELPGAQRVNVEQARAEWERGSVARGLTLHGGVVFVTLAGFALALFGSGSERWLGAGMLLVVSFTALASG
ncbi:MAG: DUF4339 domain-containing protein [Pirellulaceae bacterium]